MKVGYARLSTGDPDGLTLQIQHDRLQAAGCDRIYSEVISGNARHRPQWEALKQAIADGRVSEVVALRMDRLSRSWTAIGEVIDLFSQPGAPALSLLDEPSMDLSTIGGRTVAGVLSSVAAGERERIVARSTAGLRKRHAAGKRHKLPFGLMADHEGFPSLDRRPWLSTVQDRCTWSRAEVAEHLWSAWESAPSRYTAKRLAAQLFGLVSFQGGSAAVWACNPMLRGALTGGKRDRYGGYPSVKEDAFEPLIGKERHLTAVAGFLRERSTNTRRSEGKATPLSGKVLCAACGYRMNFHRLLSRPGHAWTFRCRREGCRLYGLRVKYRELVESCRQHLLSQQDRLLGAMAGAVAPRKVNADLERRQREACAQVDELRALVARRPTPRMQEELQQAEAELADLQLAANTEPGPTADPMDVLRVLAPLLQGEMPAIENPDGSVNLFIPNPSASWKPSDMIERILSPLAFENNLSLMVALAIHSIKADASSGAVVVRDSLDAGVSSLALDGEGFVLTWRVEGEGLQAI
jgi:DNA invertase Pin-like site-specific DNA recombinase